MDALDRPRDRLAGRGFWLPSLIASTIAEAIEGHTPWSLEGGDTAGTGIVAALGVLVAWRREGLGGMVVAISAIALCVLFGGRHPVPGLLAAVGRRMVMDRSELKRRLPGYIATGLVILTTSLWTLWSVGEMYYEGWGLPFPRPMAYLMPAAACLILTLVALTWPRLGGWLIILIGGAFTAWWWTLAAARSWLSWEWILGTFPVSGLLILTGVLFLLEGRYRQKRRAEGWTPPKSWLRRNLRYVLAVGLPLLVAVVVSAHYVPLALTRVDDGERGARLIRGHGVTLVWAPKGPGWNWKQPWGGYPSWDDLALYGVPPVGLGDKPGYEGRYATREDMEATGLCRYLSEDGTTLMSEPQDIWRMPTTDEIVRSLVRGGENAGCVWDGESDSATCERQPNKDTPLWAPDEEPIYYWSADEYDAREAYYVSYNGRISHQSKSWGNPRHGYRCVREP